MFVEWIYFSPNWNICRKTFSFIGFQSSSKYSLDRPYSEVQGGRTCSRQWAGCLIPVPPTWTTTPEQTLWRTWPYRGHLMIHAPTETRNSWYSTKIMTGLSSGERTLDFLAEVLKQPTLSKSHRIRWHFDLVGSLRTFDQEVRVSTPGTARSLVVRKHL